MGEIHAASFLLAARLASLHAGGAEDPVQETIVSARKMQEPLFDVPKSATVLDERELADAGIRTLQEASLSGEFLPRSAFS